MGNYFDNLDAIKSSSLWLLQVLLSSGMLGRWLRKNWIILVTLQIDRSKYSPKRGNNIWRKAFLS